MKKKIKKEKPYWKCKCECGNIITIYGMSLKKGVTKSCGCLNKDVLKNRVHFKDLTGMIFNRLTVIERDFNRDTKLVYWNCKCICGNFISARADSLQDDSIKSCGCLVSYGETLIKDLLLKNSILFKKNYNFKNLLSPKDGKYLFDFGILNDDGELKYLIEFDGKQHFQYNGKGWHTKIRFDKTRKSDLSKNKYCFNNNIPLIRIPYTKINNILIEDLMLGSSNYILNANNEYNYYKLNI